MLSFFRRSRELPGRDIGDYATVNESVLSQLRRYTDALPAHVRSFDASPVVYRGQGWDKMGRLYATAPPRPYVKNKRDCENHALAAAVAASDAWAEESEGHDQCLPQGFIVGVLPKDGLYVGSGAHALCWFLDESSRLWLYGAIERQVKGHAELAGIKAVWDIWLI